MTHPYDQWLNDVVAGNALPSEDELEAAEERADKLADEGMELQGSY